MKNIINESYLDDFDENDIEDVYYSDTDDIDTDSFEYFEMSNPNLFKQNINFKQKYKSLLRVNVTFQSKYDTDKDLHFRDIYRVIYNAMNEYSHMFVGSDDFFIIDMPYPDEANERSFTYELSWPLPDTLKYDDIYHSLSHSRLLFNEWRFDVYFNNFVKVSYKYAKNIIWKFRNLLNKIYNGVAETNALKSMWFTLCKNDDNRSHKIVDFISHNHSMSNKDFGLIYKGFIEDAEPKFLHMYDTDDIVPEKHSHRFNIYNDAFVNKYRFSFDKSVITKGFETAEVEYGIKFTKLFSYFIDNIWEHNEHFAPGYIVLDAKLVDDSTKKYPVHKMIQCVNECILMMIPRVIRENKSFSVFIRSDIQYTDKVTTNDDKTLLQNSPEIYSENFRHGGKYYWRIVEITDHSLWPANHSYVILGNKKGNIGCEFPNVFRTYNYYVSLIGNMMNGGDIFNKTQDDVLKAYQESSQKKQINN